MPHAYPGQWKGGGKHKVAGKDSVALDDGARLQPRHGSPPADGVDYESPQSPGMVSERARMFMAHQTTGISRTTESVYLLFVNTCE